jgi:hypothetical protein
MAKAARTIPPRPAIARPDPARPTLVHVHVTAAAGEDGRVDLWDISVSNADQQVGAEILAAAHGQLLQAVLRERIRREEQGGVGAS